MINNNKPYTDANALEYYSAENRTIYPEVAIKTDEWADAPDLVTIANASDKDTSLPSGQGILSQSRTDADGSISWTLIIDYTSANIQPAVIPVHGITIRLDPRYSYSYGLTLQPVMGQTVRAFGQRGRGTISTLANKWVRVILTITEVIIPTEEDGARSALPVHVASISPYSMYVLEEDLIRATLKKQTDITCQTLPMDELTLEYDNTSGVYDLDGVCADLWHEGAMLELWLDEDVPGYPVWPVFMGRYYVESITTTRDIIRITAYDERASLREDGPAQIISMLNAIESRTVTIPIIIYYFADYLGKPIDYYGLQTFTPSYQYYLPDTTPPQDVLTWAVQIYNALNTAGQLCTIQQSTKGGLLIGEGPGSYAEIDGNEHSHTGDSVALSADSSILIEYPYVSQAATINTVDLYAPAGGSNTYETVTVSTRTDAHAPVRRLSAKNPLCRGYSAQDRLKLANWLANVQNKAYYEFKIVGRLALELGDVMTVTTRNENLIQIRLTEITHEYDGALITRCRGYYIGMVQ